MEKQKEILLSDREHSLDCLVNNITEELRQKVSQAGDGKIVVAIGGYTALGKGTLVKKLAKSVGDAVILPVDSFILDRATKRSLGFTGDEESAVDFDTLTEVLFNLLDGKPVSIRPYDHSVGVFQEPTELSPARHVIIEGTASLYPKMTRYLDLSYFMNADEATLHKIAKETYMLSRGYSKEEFERFWIFYRSNCETFITPSMRNANEIIQVTAERRYKSHVIKICEE